MSPVNDQYGKKGLASAEHRTKMCQLASDTSSFIMADPWEASQHEYQRTLTVLRRIEACLHALGASEPAAREHPEPYSQGVDELASLRVERHGPPAEADGLGALEGFYGGALSGSGESSQAGRAESFTGGEPSSNTSGELRSAAVTLAKFHGAAADEAEDSPPGGGGAGAAAAPVVPSEEGGLDPRVPGAREENARPSALKSSSGRWAPSPSTLANRVGSPQLEGTTPACTQCGVSEPGLAPGNVPSQKVRVVLVCGADLLRSFTVPGVWIPEQLEAILAEHGVVCVAREDDSARDLIESSDLLHRHRHSILVVDNHIRNDTSSTKIRAALSRGSSVKYLLPDAVLEYVQEHGLYGCTKN